MAEERVERRLAALLAAHVVGHSRLMGAVKEGNLAGLKSHRRALTYPKCTEHRGRIVMTTATGGLVWWCLPLSEPFYEVNRLGQTYLTQYFERGRLEYHPESKNTPAEIRPNRLGLLGLIAKGWVAP